MMRNKKFERELSEIKRGNNKKFEEVYNYKTAIQTEFERQLVEWKRENNRRFKEIMRGARDVDWDLLDRYPPIKDNSTMFGPPSNYKRIDE